VKANNGLGQPAPANGFMCLPRPSYYPSSVLEDVPNDRIIRGLTLDEAGEFERHLNSIHEIEARAFLVDIPETGWYGFRRD
jgi:hypothetical protein